MPPRAELLSVVAKLRPTATPYCTFLYKQATASFSTTACQQTHLRRKFREFLGNPKRGKKFRQHEGDQPTYLTRSTRKGKSPPSHRPFPANKLFVSSPVLDEKAREIIWRKIMRDGETVKAVSAELGVDIRRVAAVVRLKEVEKDIEAKGRPMAKPYAKAVLSMLPKHSIREHTQNPPLEDINEVHVHPHTMQQIFWPTSESRRFTRVDAAKTFGDTILPVDKRVPHPELIQMEKDLLNGRSLWDATDRFKNAAMESERRAAERHQQKVNTQENLTSHIHGNRFEFRFKNYNSEQVGKRGRSREAPGWKYGLPHYDRSKGEIKIPTSVP